MIIILITKKENWLKIQIVVSIWKKERKKWIEPQKKWIELKIFSIEKKIVKNDDDDDT